MQRKPADAITHNLVKYPKSKMTRITLSKVTSVKRPSGYGSVQGFAMTDKYYVLIFRPSGKDNNNRVGIIRRSDNKDMTSSFNNPTYNMGHGNDATWNSKTNEVIVVNGTQMVRLSATTFKKLGTFSFTDSKGNAVFAGGIAYDKTRNIYHASGVDVINTFNTKNQLVFSFTEKRHQTGQGFAYNNGYLYRPTWESAGTYTNSIYDGIFEKNTTVLYQFGLDGSFTHAYYIDNPLYEVESMDFDEKNVPYFIFNGPSNYCTIYKVTDANLLKQIRQSYTISYDANGGAGAPATQTAYVGVEKALSSTKPTRSNYTFLGWSTSKTATKASYAAGAKYLKAYGSKNTNVKLYAIWKINTYKITYDANGGTGAPAAQTVEVTKNATISSTKPTRKNYTFLGWSTSKTATSATYKPGAAYTDKKNITLYAVWKANTYKITYDANGGTGAPAAQTVEVTKNATISSTKPTRSNYTFLGWSTSKTATSATYKPGAAYTDKKNITLYAVWKSNYYTITYNANGGTGAPAAQTAIIGQAVKLSTIKPTRIGYIFMGWATNQKATAAQYATGASYTGSSSITLYAVWKEYKAPVIKTVTVTFDANGGTGAPASVTGAAGNVVIPKDTPTRKNYTFLGWSTSKTATSATYKPGVIYRSSTSTTLYAIWKRKQITVTFDANGGTGAPASVTGAAGNVVIPKDTPTRKNYTFLGWATSKTATSATYKPSATYTGTTNITLYAIWEQTYVTLSYDANGGTGAPSTQKVAIGQKVTISTTKPTRNEYKFLGWNSEKNAKDAQYLPNASITLKRNMVIYAIWARESYTISFDANGGADAPLPISTETNEIVLPQTRPTRKNYTFLGWSKQKDSKKADYQPGDIIKDAKSLTLYAVWNAVSPEPIASNDDKIENRDDKDENIDDPSAINDGEDNDTIIVTPDVDDPSELPASGSTEIIVAVATGICVLTLIIFLFIRKRQQK